MINRVLMTLIGVTIAVSSGGCAAVNADALTSAVQRGTGYPLRIEFAKVLNLPDQAKVVMDGTGVGVVQKVTLVGDRVDVLARIDNGVSLPSNTHATLQQATVLGDTYVALEHDGTSSSSILAAGGRIPLSNTTSPAQLEDTIASLSNFVASGSIQRVQNTLIGLNRVTPSKNSEVRRIASQVATDLADLSNNMASVDHLLAGLSGTAQVLDLQSPILQRWLTPMGQQEFDRGSFISTYISTLVPSLGSIYSGGYWLVPSLESLGIAVGAVQQSKWGVEDEIPRWRRLFTDYYLPADKYPAINITSVVGPDGKEISNDAQAVLRVLG